MNEFSPRSLSGVCVIITQQTEAWMCDSGQQTRPCVPRAGLMNSPPRRLRWANTWSQRAPPLQLKSSLDVLKRAQGCLFHFRIKDQYFTTIKWFGVGSHCKQQAQKSACGMRPTSQILELGEMVAEQEHGKMSAPTFWPVWSSLDLKKRNKWLKDW